MRANDRDCAAANAKALFWSSPRWHPSSPLLSSISHCLSPSAIDCPRVLLLVPGISDHALRSISLEPRPLLVLLNHSSRWMLRGLKLGP